MSLLYRINVRTKAVDRAEIKEEYKYLGGRSLIAQFMNDEVPPTCDPLGAENKLIVCTSILAGTTIPTAHRLSVGGKSPLTGGIKEANAGGTAAGMLARHNIKMIVLEDKPETNQWFLLVLKKDGSGQLVPADDYVGLNNYALVNQLKITFGADVGIISIGVAGERGYSNSTLQVIDAATGQPSRAAARGGLGAVMGSKQVKAIVIQKSDTPYAFPYVDKERYERARKLFVERTISSPRNFGLSNVGTAATTDVTGPTAILPVRNFSGGFFSKLESISAAAFLTRLQVGGGKNGEACQAGCIIKCSNHFNDINGEYLTSGLEYETIALCGANCDIGDLDTIARIDRMCDDFGIDTIELGATIGICMEAGKIPWGDGEAAIGLIQEMMDGTEFGHLLGQGTEATGKALSVTRIPTVKKQAMAGYEPRNLKGIGVTYATSPMGADHTAGLTMLPGLDFMSKAGQVGASAKLQVAFAGADSFMCMFAWLTAITPDVAPEIMAGAFGGEWTMAQVFAIAVKTLLLENAFNTAAGFTATDNRLPEFFLTEKSPATGTVYDITAAEMAEVHNF